MNTDPNETADALRSFARRASDFAWALDSALSLQRKSRAEVGYRSSDATGDQPWDASAYAAKVKVAHIQALSYLRHYERPEKIIAAARELLDAFGGDTPDWLRPEASALADLLTEIGA